MKVFNIKWKRMKELMNLDRRFVYFKKRDNNYEILLDNDNCFLRTIIPFDLIKEYFDPKDEMSLENACQRFEETYLINRKNTIQFFEENINWKKAVKKKEPDLTEKLLLKGSEIIGKETKDVYFKIRDTDTL